MNKIMMASLALFLYLCSQIGFAASITRGPYLQMNGHDRITLRWRSDTPSDSVVKFGTTPSNLNQTTAVAGSRTNHEVTLISLDTDTLYYYSVGSSTEVLAGGDASYRFNTAPSPGSTSPTRIWLIGDSGTANSNAASVYNAYLNFNGADNTDLWIMLGDNAYNDGTDSEYQAAVFDIYPELLRRTPLWSTLGNHDGHSADSATESGPYYEIFSLPRNAELGGLASGTEAYYSFDYGDIHFICLDSYDSNRTTNGAMLTWLENDIAATNQKWIIAYWHHPPYTKGSHNSDTEGALIDMRQNALPILENYGVDLVFSGHSHSFERSFLIDGHYGNSGTFSASHQVDGGSGREDTSGAYQKADGASHAGAVYTVAGASGKISGGSLNHPAMFASLNELGSVVLDINGNRLDYKHLRSDGVVTDYFTLIKGPDTSAPTIVSAQAINNTSVSINFSEAVETSSAELISNYNLDQGIVVLGANASGNTVDLTTSNLNQGTIYTLTVNNIEDLEGNSIATDSQVNVQYLDENVANFQNGVSPASSYAGTQDTYLASGAPTNNWGGDAAILADGDDGTNGELISLLQWDVSAIPSTATVLSAEIQLQVFNPSSGSYTLVENTTSWDEANVTWSSLDPLATQGALVGQFSPSSSGSHVISLNTAGVAMVQNWVNGNNNGVQVVTGGSSDGIDIRSSEYATLSARPALRITYGVTGSSSSSSTSSSSSSSTSSSSSSATTTIDLQQGNAYFSAQDTYVASGSASTNWGSDSEILADGDDGPNDELVSLLKWDINTQIPQGSTVTQASITLQVFNKSNNNYDIWGLNQSWDDSSATWSNTQPDSNLGDQVGSFTPNSTGSFTINLNATGIALIQSWVDGSNNNGFVIRSGGTNNGIDIRSNEYGTVSQRPKLSITFN